MEVLDLASQLRPVIADLPSVALAYLFGSRAVGHSGPLSDYDIAILFDWGMDDEAVRMQLSLDAGRVLGTSSIDLVALNAAPIELAFNVIANGKLLYERDRATRVEYEATVMSRYADYLPVLRAQRRDILQGDDYGKRVQRYRAALGRTERTLEQIRAAQKQSPS